MSVSQTQINTLNHLAPTAVLNEGRYVQDWYLIPESYSEPLIIEAIERFGISPGDTILDPFSGAGTTVVSAVFKGINGVGLEVNPFLCFAARTKLDWDIDPKQFRTTVAEILERASPLLQSLSVGADLFTQALGPGFRNEAQHILKGLDEPEMPRLHKWMTRVVVQKVLVLRHLIENEVPERLRNHFLLALAAILRPVSNMKLTPHAFGSNKQKEDAPVYDLFCQKLLKIADDLDFVRRQDNSFGKGTIYQCDARRADGVLKEIPPVSLAITSPPYLNNLDYTMQTRMELFFLRFMKSMADLRNLRKEMVICDAKAMYKDVLDSKEIEDVASIQKIASRLKEVHKDKNWGWDYAFMTIQYFGGMFKTLKAVKRLLRRRARFVLIVGESAHSGVKVPVPDILAELGEKSGYHVEGINVLRRRRSSSHQFELCESEVILQKK